MTATLLAPVLALALGACSGDDDDDTEGGSGTTTTTIDADCDPARPMEPSEDAQTLSFDGEERSYQLHLPDGYDGTTAQPLLLGFHGHGGSKEGAAVASQLGEKGTARGYVVVFADALGDPRAWNFGVAEGRADDFGFVDALIEDLSSRLCIDAERIYAAGHSNGSAFTGLLACQRPYRFAAVAMVSAFLPSPCPVEEAAPAVMAVHGTADPGVPYEGGPVAGGPALIGPAPATLDYYRDHYRCDPTPEETEPQPGVQRKGYTGCIRGTEAVLYSVVGGGHEWPDERFAASDSILDFFDAHTRP